jgi:predicted RNA binding protein YcfA (HicA-like mRNA interferase family)
MSDFPAVSGRRLVAALERLGFAVVRTRGSHCFLKHRDGRRTVVPVHRGETIGRGLLAKITRDCDLSPDALRRAL